MKTEVKNTIRSAAPPEEHSLSLVHREQLTLTGVLDVETFDETELVLQTVQGRLTIQGQMLHVTLLQLESGQLQITGTVDAMLYSSGGSREGFWARLFG